MGQQPALKGPTVGDALASRAMGDTQLKDSKYLFTHTFPKIDCKSSIASRVRIFSWSRAMRDTELERPHTSPSTRPLRSREGQRGERAREPRGRASERAKGASPGPTVGRRSPPSAQHVRNSSGRTSPSTRPGPTVGDAPVPRERRRRVNSPPSAQHLHAHRGQGGAKRDGSWERDGS